MQNKLKEREIENIDDKFNEVTKGIKKLQETYRILLDILKTKEAMISIAVLSNIYKK